MLVLCSSLTAFAEDDNSNTNQPQQMGDGAPEGTPSKMPESEFPGGPGMGTPPEMPEGGFLGGPAVLVGLPAARLVDSRNMWKGSWAPGPWAAPTRKALKVMTTPMTPRCM
jgi:hypothetical protein